MYKVTEEVLNSVLSYLGKQPYVETFKIIADIQQCIKSQDTLSDKTEDVVEVVENKKEEKESKK